MTAALAANFLDKLAEIVRIGKVQDGVGLRAMPVSAADNELIPMICKIHRALVFFPASNTAQLEGMHEHAELGNEIIHGAKVPLRANAGDVPHWMIQNDQNFAIGVQRFEEILQIEASGIPCAFCEPGHRGFRAVAREVVNSQVQCCASVRQAPFNGDRCGLCFRHNLQEHRRFDAVVVGQRDHACKAEQLFDLTAFQQKGGEGRKRRSPISPCEIHGD